MNYFETPIDVNLFKDILYYYKNCLSHSKDYDLINIQRENACLAISITSLMYQSLGK